MTLALFRGPSLACRDWETCPWVEVRHVAHRYLFQPVHLQTGITLRDVLSLFEHCHELLNVFANTNASYYTQYVDQISIGRDQRDRAFEFVELSLAWGLERRTGVIDPLPCVDILQVFGAADERHVAAVHAKVGDINYFPPGTISESTLLALPLRICPRLEIVEADLDSIDRWRIDCPVQLHTLSLGQLLSSVVGALEWSGFADLSERPRRRPRLGPIPGDALIFGARARAALKGIKAPEREHRFALAALFDRIGDCLATDVRNEILGIENDASAVDWLRGKLGKSIALKSPFAAFTGIELRRALRRVEEALGQIALQP